MWGPHELYDKMKDPKPKSLKEVPKYVKNVFSHLFSRLFYIFKLVWEAKKLLLFTMVFMAVFNGVMPVVGSLVSANLLNRISYVYTAAGSASDLFSFTMQDQSGATVTAISLLLSALVLQFGYTFLYGLVNRINNIITNISSEIVTNHIKIKIMGKAKEIDLSSFDMPDFYERMENANREAGSRPVNIMSSTFSMVSQIISLISYIVILVVVVPQLGNLKSYFIALMIVFIAFSIFSALVSFYFRRRNFLYMRRRSKDRRQMNYYSDLLVNKDMVKELRLFDLADVFIGRYKEVFARYFKGIKKLTYQEGACNIGISLITSVLNCSLFFIIAAGIKADAATGVRLIGNYSLYTGALNNISSAIASLINIFAWIYEGTLFIDNMILFMNEEQTIKPTVAEPPHLERHCGHTIVLDHVSFAYPGVDHKVLKDINLRLDPGDTAVLVGLNGAGKTTLIKLLTRLYDPTEGTIYLDGHDIREYDTKELYSIFGIIFQDFGKYAMTVTENISFGDISKSANEDNIEYAATQSSANIFIDKLPHGYDTPLMRYFEKDGIELSIGQWQKLSIARAFYSDSDILILDEPTASLDPMAEQEIFNQFDLLRADKTTIFVSHRLSSATTANKIIVLKDGEIIEMGDHQTLMAAKGEYYTLFSTQAKRYISNENESILTENIAHGERPTEDGVPFTPVQSGKDEERRRHQSPDLDVHIGGPKPRDN